MSKKRGAGRRSGAGRGDGGNRGDETAGRACAPAGYGWRITFLVLCTIGVCMAADLARLHLNVHTDPEYHSYCAMSARVNCDTVAASEYAVVLGLPMAVWGLLGYVALGAMAVWGLRRRPKTLTWPFGLLFWAGLFLSAGGVGLFLLSHLVIESVCIVCAGSYLVNLGLLATAFLVLRRSGEGPVGSLAAEARSVAARPAAFAAFCVVVGVAAAILWFSVPRYWVIEAATGPGGVPVGETPEGHPWIGARTPALEIVEYSDYQCPHCPRAHDEIRKLVLAQPERVRLVHRQYPLDHKCNAALRRPFHPHACAYARMAWCAQAQGRFWEANDFLFANGRHRVPVTPADLAAGAGLDAAKLDTCLGGQEVGLAIQKDLAAGRALQIHGTPTFVVGGETYPGRIPPEVLAPAPAPATGPPPR